MATESQIKQPFPHMLFRRPLVACIIFAITVLAFARLTTCNFTWWDDQDTIRENRRLNPPTWATLNYYWTTANQHDTMGLYIPVTYTVWSALALVGRLDHPDAEGLTLNPMVFHTANVLLHAVTAVMVFWLLVSLGDRRRALPAAVETPASGSLVPAIFGAFIFALHPVQVEAVGWISGTKDILCGLLSISALLAYLRSRYWLGMLLFVLAMLSKPTAVVVPFMAGAVSVVLLDQPLRRTIISLIPWGLLMIPCMIWTRQAQPAELIAPVAIWMRPFVAADALTFYLGKLLWPMRLCVDYGHNPDAIIASGLVWFTWIVPAALIGILWWRFDRSRAIAAAALLFVIPLIPVLGLVTFEFQQVSTTADHYLYLPMLGIALLAMMALRQIDFKVRGICAVLLILLGVRSIFQEANWQDTRTLSAHTLTVNPHSSSALDGLGFVAGRDARRTEKAGDQNQANLLFQESIRDYEQSLVCDPTSVPSMVNLSLDFEKIGRFDLAREQLHHVINLQSTLPAYFHADPIYLAHLLIDANDLSGAVAWLDSVLRQNPDNFTAALLRQEALAHLQQSPR